MPLVLIGVNHKTCPLEIREKFFLQPDEQRLLLAEFNNDPSIVGAVILSTCNRTEIYADVLFTDAKVLLHKFLDFKGFFSAADEVPYFYSHFEKDAVTHLFSVVAGLDSLILGEKQILGQFRTALGMSRNRRMMSRTLNVLANMAIETGRRVRCDTQIDSGGSSVSWAAVTEAQTILGSLADKTVLVLGCGKMGFQAVQELRNKGVRKIYIMNRDHGKAVELAGRCGAQAVMFWQMKDILLTSDMCICSTGAPHYLVEKELVQEVMSARPDRKMALIDIAVPRNIDPHTSDVSGVVLVSVDGLSRTVLATRVKRMAAVEQAREIINAKMDEFYRGLDRAARYSFMKETGISGATPVR